MDRKEKERSYLCDVKKIADAILPEAIKIDGRGRTGGYLCITNPFGTILALLLIGHVKDESEAQKYRENAQKKVVRLHLNPGHISGWQTRNEEKKDWGGSIRDKAGHIYGFSGFNELVDEAFSTAVAYGLCDSEMPEELQNAIASISGNQDIEYLCSVGDVIPVPPGLMWKKGPR